MQTTSQRWKNLVQGDYYTNSRLKIDGAGEFNSDSLISMSITQEAFRNGTIGVGGCVYSRLDVKLIAASERIPRMAKLTPYVQLTDGKNVSEWLKMGEFYIDNRNVDVDTSVITIRAYDALMMTEQTYREEGVPWYDRTDIQVVEDVCRRLHFGLNSKTRSLLKYKYKITDPLLGDGAKTIREVLEYIAAAYCGNWVMNAAGELTLVQLNALPEETNYLITTDGSPIFVGGDYIYVN